MFTFDVPGLSRRPQQAPMLPWRWFAILLAVVATLLAGRSSEAVSVARPAPQRAAGAAGLVPIIQHSIAGCLVSIPTYRTRIAPVDPPTTAVAVLGGCAAAGTDS